MVDIPKVPGEADSLPLHVEMCVLRYRQIIRFLYLIAALTIAIRFSQADALAAVTGFFAK